MLRRIRIILATLFFMSVTALFVDATGMVKEWLGWTAKIQFLPALLALNVVTVLALVVLTLLVGRAYCSSRMVHSASKVPSASLLKVCSLQAEPRHAITESMNM